jgi:hypothetical protein
MAGIYGIVNETMLPLTLSAKPRSPLRCARVKAHFEGLGGVRFHIANGKCPDGRHVRATTGPDYRDATPVSGVRRGGRGRDAERQDWCCGPPGQSQNAEWWIGVTSCRRLC